MSFSSIVVPELQVVRKYMIVYKQLYKMECEDISSNANCIKNIFDIDY